MDRETGRSRGFGFVTFAEKAQAEAACTQMNQAVRSTFSCYSICFSRIENLPCETECPVYTPIRSQLKLLLISREIGALATRALLTSALRRRSMVAPSTSTLPRPAPPVRPVATTAVGPAQIIEHPTAHSPAGNAAARARLGWLIFDATHDSIDIIFL